MALHPVRDLPTTSGFLAGRGPVDPRIGTRTDALQVYFRLTDDLRPDERSHAHTVCDELFVVLAGALVIEADDRELVVGPRQSWHCPAGLFHRIVRALPPLEAFVIRAPSVDDKVYR
jgi:mannose-6-phosphate isomerase-like protein (cupin superfamily)